MRGYGTIEEQPDSEETKTERTPLANPRRNDSNSANDRRFACAVGSKERLILLGVLFGSCFLLSGFAVRSSSPRVASMLQARRRAEDDPLYYDEQLVDHEDPGSKATWSQRYFEKTDYFAGPGHPFFVIMGGEDPVENILYPFVSEHLAKRTGGYTLNPEHRFYGRSYPIKHPTNADLRKLLSPGQAMYDTVQLIQYKRRQFGCGPRGSRTYCPVVTIGGSYPGFLAVLLRLVHSDVVDIGYGSSAPLHLYAHNQDRNVYFEKITQVADDNFPGCADAVRTALSEVKETLSTSLLGLESLASEVGVCRDSIPEYINSNELLAQELMMVAASHFAEGNMEFYPPSEDTEFARSCRVFLEEGPSSMEKMSSFLRMREGFEECFDLRSEVPPGPNGEISNADWSGVGDGPAGLMWDFQSCTLIEDNGFSERSMFPPRRWTLEFLTDYCERRFGYTPVLDALVRKYGFDDLSRTSRVLLTNGINDGWSVASVITNIPRSTVVINMPNGAHHSDLSHEGPREADTPDVRAAHYQISNLMVGWLEQIMQEPGR